MSKKHYQEQNDPGNSIFTLVERGIGRLLDLLFKKNQFEVFPEGELKARWEEIEMMEPKMAIIEADKLVDTVLKRAGVKGETMADRLRRAERLVDRSSYQAIWDAHKVRNQLVHEYDHGFNENQANEVLWKMKKFLVALGAFKNE